MPKSRPYFTDIETLDFIYDDPKKIDYFFAECSALAYKASTVAKREYAKIGFKSHNYYSVEGAQCHMVWNDDHIIVAFRGTEPNKFSDISADLEITKEKSMSGEGYVHEGFKEEVDKLWKKLQSRFKRTIEDGHRTVWICGHSLGAAMATIFASRVEQVFDNSIKLYTYGSPRCGGKKFINSISNIPHKRFVNNNDIVTCVPSRIRFKHHGVRQYITSNGKVARLSNWSRFKDKVSGFFRDLIKGSIDWFSDHSIEEYSSKLKNVWKSNTKFIEV